MDTCNHCGGFVPTHLGQCPACGARSQSAPSTAARGLARLAAGAGVVVTLMACYGMAYVPEENAPASSDCTSPDTDGDGYCGDLDCDEQDPSIHRDAQDPFGDGVDTNCNGEDG